MVTENIVKFKTNKVKFYGEGNSDLNVGIGNHQHRVQLQRVPNYRSVNLTAGNN